MEANLNLRAEAIEEGLSSAVVVFAHSEGMTGEGPKDLAQRTALTAQVIGSFACTLYQSV